MVVSLLDLYGFLWAKQNLYQRGNFFAATLNLGFYIRGTLDAYPFIILVLILHILHLHLHVFAQICLITNAR